MFIHKSQRFYLLILSMLLPVVNITKCILCSGDQTYFTHMCSRLLDSYIQVINMEYKRQKKQEKRIIYYENELEDEFSEAQITPRKIDENYQYEGGVMRRLGRIFWYHIIAKPLAAFFLKIKYQHKIVNRECLKAAKETGFFLYGNHTNAIADALIPTMICRPTGVYVIVHPNNVSMPVLGRITPSLGALPLPDDKPAMKNFSTAMEHILAKRNCITIYPEAHIWPYYTKIRNFKDTSFRYPVKLDVPVYCFTNTYQKKRRGNTPRIVTYVDGPFYADKNLSVREQKQQLHEQVMASMKKYSRNSNVELIQYIKKEE